MTPQLFPLETRLAAHWPSDAWEPHGLLMAVSGGADSVALLRACERSRSSGAARLAAGHFHHGLRGAEADGDAAFVTDLCRSLGVLCFVGQAETAAGQTDEAALREARYAFLRETAEREGLRLIATAHTADDQAETVLHRIVRGTGLRGLAGIPAARPLSAATTIVRPLLPFRRSEVLGYLTELEQNYRRDSSNETAAYTRNRIRHEILPLLSERVHPGAVEALVRLGAQAEEVMRFLEPQIAALQTAAVERELAGDEIVWQIDCERLRGQPHFLIGELLAMLWREAGWPIGAMGYAEWRRLTAAIGQDPAGNRAVEQAIDLPGGIRAQRSRGRLTLQPQ